MKRMVVIGVGVWVLWGWWSPLWGWSVQEVTASVLNVRTGPSTGYRVQGVVYRGQKYVAITSSGGWYKIWYRGGVGWCSAKYLRTVSGSRVLQIRASILNVRRGPGTRYGRVGVAHNPEMYVIVGQSGSWRKIWFGGGAYWCYAGNGYATEVGSSSPNPQPQPQPKPQPQPPSGSAVVVHGVDISHWTGNISDRVAQNWKNLGVKHVICGTQREAITRQQLGVAVRNGFTVDAYVYLYFRGNMTYQVKEALRRIRGFPVTRLWLDIEDRGAKNYSLSKRKAKIWESIRAAGNFPHGIYTGKWWWTYYVKNTSDFSHLPLWYARYDKNPSLSTWSRQKFGGWSWPWGKQYQGTTRYGGATVDLNTIKVLIPRRNRP